MNKRRGLNILKINSNAMTGIIKLCVAILVACTILRAIKYRSETVEIPDIAEVLFNFFKSAGYGLLAWYIYAIMKKMQFPKIDVITFFTFLLACFEASHNFMNSIGNWLALAIDFILPKSKY